MKLTVFLIIVIIAIFISGCINLGEQPPQPLLVNDSSNILNESQVPDNQQPENETIEPNQSANETPDDSNDTVVNILCQQTSSGVTIGDQIYSNRCDGNTSIRYTCVENDVAVGTVQCNRGEFCIEGECTVVPCYDEDNGNPYKRGTAFYRRQEYVDACSNKFNLREFSCRGDKLVSQIVT